MLSNLLAFNSEAITKFLTQVTEALGFLGCFAIALAVELLFVLLFVIRSIFSYEARLKRSLDVANTWLFKNKKIDSSNIKAFNKIIKSGPKRFAYYWQQFILNREGGPCEYMTVENVVEKPLRTSSWKNNVRNLGLITGVWAFITLIFGFASQTQAFTFASFAVALIIPALVLVIGAVAVMLIKGRRVSNLDDIYHLYHIFARFVTNACSELPPYIDFDLLFTPKEIENGNVQIREYYEERARKAKEEFEKAKKSEATAIDYNFREVGVDGALLLERAMKESEMYITTKNLTLSQLAQVEAQKDALKRNYENVQMDLQRKIQASKENIQNLIEQQATTSNRFEVGRLRERQDKEVKKQEALQKDYDTEENRYLASKADLDEESARLGKILSESLTNAEKGMTNEYQAFFKKVMKSAYTVAEGKVLEEKNSLENEKNNIEAELTNVQTQIKRLLDENVTLRAKLDELLGNDKSQTENAQGEAYPEGQCDENGNFIYADGSYHDTKGLFHDVDGKIYDMNGLLVGEDENKKQDQGVDVEKLIDEQAEKFGNVAREDVNADETVEPKEETVIAEEIVNPFAETDKLEETVATEEAKEEETPKEEEKIEEIKVEEAVNPFAEPQTESKVEKAEEVEVKEEPKENPQTKKTTKPRKTTKSTSTQATTKAPAKKRGRPRKTTASQTEKTSSAPKKRGRPRKNPVENPVTEKRKRGRPRKNTAVDDDLAKINALINEEEARLNYMKALLGNRLNQAIENDEQENINKEKDALLEAVEALKNQADTIKNNDHSSEDLSQINKRLEDLISDISSLNNKK